MGIEVGAVNTTLTVSDAASAPVAAYTAKVAALEYQLGTLGVNGPQAFAKLNTELLQTQAKLADLQAEAGKTTASLGAMQTGAEDAAGDDGGSGGFSRMDSLASRLVARFQVKHECAASAALKAPSEIEQIAVLIVGNSRLVVGAAVPLTARTSLASQERLPSFTVPATSRTIPSPSLNSARNFSPLRSMTVRINF